MLPARSMPATTVHTRVMRTAVVRPRDQRGGRMRAADGQHAEIRTARGTPHVLPT